MTLGRFAPTPSGYLHLGNAVNAVLCAWQAASLGGGVLLRIDDLDTERRRDAYERDILDLVTWLGIEPTAIVRQSERLERYVQARDRLLASGLAFACICSRRDRALGRACRCEHAGHDLETGVSALRWRSTHDDVVLWRRDGVPAYHLASVVDDEELGITHIVRGQDLRAATGVQIELARLLDMTGFLSADVRFHALLTDAGGAKLSKSQLGADPLPRTDATRLRIHDAARALGAPLGIPAG